jgi:HK97 gp10 family phage protein
MNLTYSIEGVPELNAHLDSIAMAVANPIAKEALEAGGEVVRAAAEGTVPHLTGALAEDLIIVTRIRNDGAEKYVLIGPGWEPDGAAARNRGASNRGAAASASMNPGVYGYFVEVGHRAAGAGLSHNLQFKRDSAAAKKRGQRVDTGKYGHLSTPAYPWLGPAFDGSKEQAVQKMGEVIEQRLGNLGI